MARKQLAESEKEKGGSLDHDARAEEHGKQLRRTDEDEPVALQKPAGMAVYGRPCACNLSASRASIESRARS